MPKKIIGNLEVTNSITSYGKGVVLSVNDKLADTNGNVELEASAGFYVGQRVWHNSRGTPPAGMMAADGQILQRALYPKLFNYVSTGGVPIADDSAWLANPAVRGCFTLGDGSTTFRIPDWNGSSGGSIQAPVFRGDGGGLSPGSLQNNGAPNIVGAITDISANNGVSGTTGVFSIDWKWPNNTNVTQGSTTWSQYNFGFDASRSSAAYGRDGTTEVRMNSLIGCNMIVFASGVINADLIDAMALSSQVAALDTKVDKVMADYATASIGFYVGQKVWHNSRQTPPPGMTPSDGQLLNRAIYSNLFNYIQNTPGVPIASDADWLSDVTKRGCFTLGDGSTTFRVPDWNGEYTGSLSAPVFRGDSSVSVGTIQQSASPNITGSWGSNSTDGGGAGTVNVGYYSSDGAFDIDYETRWNISNVPTAQGNQPARINFDASRVSDVYGRDSTDEVRMNSVIGCNMIVFATGVMNLDQIDVLQLSSQVSNVELGLTNTNNRIGYALISVSNPALGSRTVLENPFGNSVPVICVCEIYHNTLLKWSTTPWLYTSGNTYGMNSAYSENEGIVLRIGSNAYVNTSASCGASQEIATQYTTPSPVRIHVWKVTQ